MNTSPDQPATASPPLTLTLAVAAWAEGESVAEEMRQPSRAMERVRVWMKGVLDHTRERVPGLEGVLGEVDAIGNGQGDWIVRVPSNQARVVVAVTGGDGDQRQRAREEAQRVIREHKRAPSLEETMLLSAADFARVRGKEILVNSVNVTNPRNGELECVKLSRPMRVFVRGERDVPEWKWHGCNLRSFYPIEAREPLGERPELRGRLPWCCDGSVHQPGGRVKEGALAGLSGEPLAPLPSTPSLELSVVTSPNLDLDGGDDTPALGWARTLLAEMTEKVEGLNTHLLPQPNQIPYGAWDGTFRAPGGTVLAYRVSGVQSGEVHDQTIRKQFLEALAARWPEVAATLSPSATTGAEEEEDEPEESMSAGM